MEQAPQRRRVTDEEFYAAGMRIDDLLKEQGVSLDTLREIRHPELAAFVQQILSALVKTIIVQPTSPGIPQMIDMIVHAVKDPETLIKRFAEAADDVTWADDLIPRILPETWKRIEPAEKGVGMFSNVIGMKAILTGKTEDDGRRWLHLSISHPKRIPNYDELVECKQLFLRNLKAIQIFAPKEEHVNVHEYCLHLWACLDDMGLPDFRRGLGTI